MERRVISTGKGMPPTGPFVQAIKVGNFLRTSPEDGTLSRRTLPLPVPRGEHDTVRKDRVADARIG